MLLKLELQNDIFLRVPKFGVVFFTCTRTMNAMNVEGDDGTLIRPSAPPPPKRWCWCIPRLEYDYNDTAWYRKQSLYILGLFMVLVQVMLGLISDHLEEAKDDLSNIKAVLGSPPPNYEYLMESIPPTATAKALDALTVINTKALEGWVVDQFLSPGIIACTEASSSHNLCPAILFKKPL